MDDATIEEFRPVVRGIVNRIAGRLPAHVDADDLYSVGYLGLLDASERFDPSRGVLFKTFASHRITGAVIDHLRELDWVPRGTRAKGKALAHAQANASQAKGSRAEDEDVAAELGIELPEYYDLVAHTAERSLNSLDKPIGIGEESNYHEVVADDVQPAEDRLSDLESAGLALSVLTEQERTVIERCVMGGENLKAVGERLGVTEARAHQIKTKALKRMALKLAA